MHPVVKLTLLFAGFVMVCALAVLAVRGGA